MSPRRTRAPSKATGVRVARGSGCSAPLAAAIVLGLLGTGVYQVITWPDVAALRTRSPESTAFIDHYRERQRAAGEDDGVEWKWVSYDRISPHLKRAVVVAEDINFFTHEGFALDELQNAVNEALEGEGLRGASTITQQLAKNLWLSPSRNPVRKLKEAVLTRQLERRLTKRRILEIYLNVVEFGPGIYGAEAASRRYFGRSAAELSELQAAQLAAALPRPSSWGPHSQSRRYRASVDRILYWMDRADFLRRMI